MRARPLSYAVVSRCRLPNGSSCARTRGVRDKDPARWVRYRPVFSPLPWTLINSFAQSETTASTRWSTHGSRCRAILAIL